MSFVREGQRSENAFSSCKHMEMTTRKKGPALIVLRQSVALPNTEQGTINYLWPSADRGYALRVYSIQNDRLGYWTIGSWAAYYYFGWECLFEKKIEFVTTKFHLHLPSISYQYGHKNGKRSLEFWETKEKPILLPFSFLRVCEKWENGFSVRERERKRKLALPLMMTISGFPDLRKGNEGERRFSHYKSDGGRKVFQFTVNRRSDKPYRPLNVKNITVLPFTTIILNEYT